MDPFLCDTIRTIREIYGRDLGCYETSFLSKALRARLDHNRIEAAAYPAYIASNGDEATSFIASLRITYSEFFRDTLSFSLLEHVVLPGIAESKDKNSEIRIWSAGCAAGQEAYSIAILLDELASSSSRNMRYRIFATDLSEQNLETARRGVYDPPSLRNVTLGRIERYFARLGDSYSILPELREHLAFSRHDLLDANAAVPAESIFGEFDLVLCCNLLFYYTRDVRNDILDRLLKSTASNGYLVTGDAERGEVERHGGYRLVSPPHSVFRKSSAGRKQ